MRLRIKGVCRYEVPDMASGHVSERLQGPLAPEDFIPGPGLISAAYQPAADARDKPEHDERVADFVSSLSRLRPVAMPRRRRVPPC
ncbi:hypothetical protein E0H63_08555 [Rhizobium leguminosarum bv. viciae]|nr:hypothetical protein [Rhizobium leguminosarum bv. viciae]TBY20053.1 hypothetical protein E0H30_17880 [Rhizobium leguminosarum bv. viciae]TBY34869.1 hypothetical protein E0H37_00765 [Rhizobium leguminosarum bv. viciae]TCA07762.1 hypothetical protein E0H63_08555 [Rhizobium leguminosarum bv. viciae]TCA86315.1 hypothetical protein E0H74_08105 [Rhizobium leguminosarum bv. viciae]